MSDIHGNLQRFDSILKQINLQPEDTLYILGDVIDRYPDGIKILKQVMSMPNIKMILGNHEHMMLEALNNPCDNDGPIGAWYHERRIILWYRNGGDVTHKQLKHYKKAFQEEMFNFLENLPINIDVEINDKKYKLVHASPIENFEAYSWSRREYKDEREFAVWERWDETMPVPEGCILVFGHTPTCHFQNKEPWSIWKNDEAIGIDCGGAYEIGRLSCLRLDDMKEFYSKEDII
jgi:serine/threonine protein phosphatase 1